MPTYLDWSVDVIHDYYLETSFRVDGLYGDKYLSYMSFFKIRNQADLNN
jgi:hypothetical protein